MKSDAIAVVTVHGTGDTADGPDGEKWFQRGSTFSRALADGLQRRGHTVEIVPHLWSGGNSAWEREKGAERLARTIESLDAQYAGVHVVGHSHGGNVAHEAAVLLRWGADDTNEARIDSLTTVGTPFLATQSGRWQVLSAYMFVSLIWMSLLAIWPAWLFTFFAVVSDLMAGRTSGALVFLLSTSIGGPYLIFVMNLAHRNLRRAIRSNPEEVSRVSVFAILHENDEAIAFLRNVETMPLEAFPRWSLFRGAQRNAISFSILAAISPLIGIPIYHLIQDSFQSESIQWGMAESSFGSGAMVSQQLLSILFAPLTFSAAYMIYRFGVGGAQEVAFRGPLNRFAARILRGIALGQDSDQIIGDVSSKSHVFPTEQLVLGGEVASRMQDRAENAATALLAKYRWSLFNVGDQAQAPLGSLARDAMTWDSLIHTTYFDQPELAEVVANRIAERAAVKSAAERTQQADARRHKRRQMATVAERKLVLTAYKIVGAAIVLLPLGAALSAVLSPMSMAVAAVGLALAVLAPFALFVAVFVLVRFFREPPILAPVLVPLGAAVLAVLDSTSGSSQWDWIFWALLAVWGLVTNWVAWRYRGPKQPGANGALP